VAQRLVVPGGASNKCGSIPMESLIAAVARALEAGDPLGALNRVALRDDAAAPALRGIAMVLYGFPERDSDERESGLGQSRRFGPPPMTSGLPPIVLQNSIFADDQNSAGCGRDLCVQGVRDLTASRKIHRRLR
jgi:hypothetical protein